MSDMENEQGQETPPLTFNDFEKPSYEAWYEAAVEALRGGDFEKLRTRTYEGITLEPLFWPQDAADISHQHTLPGEFPYVRGSHASGYLKAPWHVAQALPYPTPETFNEALLYDMARGQTAVNLPLDKASRRGLDPDSTDTDTVGRDGVNIATLDDLRVALRDVSLSETPLYIDAGTSALPVAGMLAALVDEADIEATTLQGSVALDPLRALASDGVLPTGLEALYDEMAMLTRWAVANAPGLGTIAIDTTLYHEGGANAVQELAYALATGVAYLRAMLERGVHVETAARHVRFTFAVGPNFFMEIAKLRAARMLWAQVIEAFDGSADVARAPIFAHTGHYHKTVHDPYVNMLRTTTEALTGALAGADSMDVTPFDAVIRPPDAFSRRIARNQQIILQEEVHLTKLIDPAGGSWYVEKLTDELGQKAWETFQAIEGEGGMVASMEAGTVQRAVADVAVQRAERLAQRKDRLIGTNIYPNLQEADVKPDDTDYDAVYLTRGEAVRSRRQEMTLDSLSGIDAVKAAFADGATLNQVVTALRGSTQQDEGEDDALTVTPVCLHRVAEPFERLRARAKDYAEHVGHPPQIFMANMGPLIQHKARADFSIGFFEVGGFDMIRTDGYDTAQAAADAAVASGAPAVVICSTDEDYPNVVGPIAQRVKEINSDAVVILAGYPKDQVESHREAGVDAFIHLKADCLAINKWLLDQVGA